MNTDPIKFEKHRFIYPVAEGIYSAREFSFVCNGADAYAASSYSDGGKEGIMLVGEDILTIPSAFGGSFHPVAVMYKGTGNVFWSEYADKWILKSTLEVPLPDLRGNLFVYSGLTDCKGDIYLACEHLHDYMRSDICVLQFDGNSWRVHEKINEGRAFCKRPVMAACMDRIYVVWDGYDNGYGIYTNSISSGSSTGEMKISDTADWNLKPSAACDGTGTLWVAWLRCAVVERDGVVSRTNHVHMARCKDSEITPVSGNDSREVVQLNLGLLPAERYFGYHGLRRNPQLACFENGGVGLFWESQRDETENWENVENGWFLCRVFNGSWGPTHIIQEGGNCFTLDSSSMVGEKINYAYRGNRRGRTDINITSLDVSDLEEFNMPVYSSWQGWKPYKPRKRSSKEGIFWGDLHCHSIYSPDAEGYPDELFFYARDVAGIDFCAITDNDVYAGNILMLSALRYISTLCRHISANGIFQAFAGFEWTYHKPGLDEPRNFNHRTVIFFDDDVTIASRAFESGSCESAFRNTLAGSKTMWHAHHGIWKLLDPVHEMNVEIVSAWENNIESFNTVRDNLNNGSVFGFMGASDNHRSIPGNGGALTGVFSKELTKDALMESFRRRSNYATCGSRTYIKLSISGSSMGDLLTVEKSTGINAVLRIVSDRDVDYIEPICNGVSMGKVRSIGMDSSVDINLDGIPRRCWLYIRIRLLGNDRDFEHNLALAEGNYVYTSPVWINVTG